jgi:hypothetical protein
MKYVQCVHQSGSAPLTKGKIYEVIHIHRGMLQTTQETASKMDWVRIINDDGIEEFYYISDTDGTWFVDATAFVREQKLKQLGIL